MASDILSQSALAQQLAAAGFPVDAIVRLTGDVSPRVYFRAQVRGGRSAVLAAYPVGVSAGCRRFEITTRLLEEAGVRVPRILAADESCNWMLLEDLGEETLYEPRPPDESELVAYLDRAADYLLRIAALPPGPVASLNPPLDEVLLLRELRQTWELCLVPRSLTGGPDLERRLRRTLDELCRTLAGFEPCPNHRDFMARNLVPVGPSPGLAVLDHQDLRMGPPRYDLASLLNDSLFPPPEVEEELLVRWAPMEKDREHYHLAAIQRTLKACGTYEAFARRGSPRHLSLLAPTLGRCLLHLRRHPDTASLAESLEPVWGPFAAGGRVGPIC